MGYAEKLLRSGNGKISNLAEIAKTNLIKIDKQHKISNINTYKEYKEFVK